MPGHPARLRGDRHGRSLIRPGRSGGPRCCSPRNLTVAPSGNGSAITDSPLVSATGIIPVASGCHDGAPHPQARFSPAVGKHGLLAPGARIPGAGPGDSLTERSGSSFAAAFVTAFFALLHSLEPRASALAIWSAILAPHPVPGRRTASRHPALMPRRAGPALIIVCTGSEIDEIRGEQRQCHGAGSLILPELRVGRRGRGCQQSWRRRTRMQGGMYRLRRMPGLSGTSG